MRLFNTISVIAQKIATTALDRPQTFAALTRAHTGLAELRPPRSDSKTIEQTASSLLRGHKPSHRGGVRNCGMLLRSQSILSSLRAKRSNPVRRRRPGLLRRYAPRNDAFLNQLDDLPYRPSQNVGGQPVTVTGKVKFFNETKGYPAANAVLGTTYGNPGGGNFTVPDMRGRYPYNLDSGGSGRITAAGGNWDGTVLGNTGGAQNRTIAQNQLPNVSPTFIGSSSSTTQTAVPNYAANNSLQPVNAGTNFGVIAFANTANPTIGALTVTPLGSVNSINGGVTQQATATLPPSMGIYFMMRIA